MATDATKKRKRSQLPLPPPPPSGSSVTRPATAPAPRPPTFSPFFARRASAPTATAASSRTKNLVAAIATSLPSPPPVAIATPPPLLPTLAPASASAQKHEVEATSGEETPSPTRPELYDPTVRPKLPSAAYWRKGGDGQRYATLSQRDWDAASEAYGRRKTPRPAWWIAHDEWWSERDRERALLQHQRRQQHAKKQRQKRREDAAADERHRLESRETKRPAVERKKAHIGAPISAQIARQLVAFLRYGAPLLTPADRRLESTGDVGLPIPSRIASDKSTPPRAGGTRTRGGGAQTRLPPRDTQLPSALATQ